MKVMLAAVMAALLLAGCATGPTFITPKTLIDVNEGRSAIIVLSMRNKMDCISEGAYLASDHASGQNRYRPSVDIVDIAVDPGEVFSQIVAPGRFRFQESSCLRYHLFDFLDPNSGHFVAKSLQAWFSDVEIKPGEVVYIGTLVGESIDGHSEVPLWEQIWNLNPQGAGPDRYPVFTMTDETDLVREELRKRHPEIADQMITRLPEAILSRDDFAQAFRNAYVANADGTLPTREEARARLNAEINKAMKTSKAKYDAAHPDLETKAPPPRTSNKTAPAEGLANAQTASDG